MRLFRNDNVEIWHLLPFSERIAGVRIVCISLRERRSGAIEAFVTVQSCRFSHLHHLISSNYIFAIAVNGEKFEQVLQVEHLRGSMVGQRRACSLIGSIRRKGPSSQRQLPRLLVDMCNNVPSCGPHVTWTPFCSVASSPSAFPYRVFMPS